MGTLTEETYLLQESSQTRIKVGNRMQNLFDKGEHLFLLEKIVINRFQVFFPLQKKNNEVIDFNPPKVIIFPLPVVHIILFLSLHDNI